ncbi:sigma factor [Mucilaginibacter sp. CAU 1740]|uniref:sigma factor n=1 Tax=Mucilaginibacter sp. CAU 1740 TaxID=3140365 RepID=UPI00325A6886
MERELPHTDLLPHLFRQEYARITAALCRYLGLREVELAEDIASDAFLKASEHWALHGLPKDPVAWLYTVARNKVRDHLKHRSIVDSYAKIELARDPAALRPAAAHRRKPGGRIEPIVCVC